MLMVENQANDSRFSASCRKRRLIEFRGSLRVRTDRLRDPITSSENGNQPVMSIAKCELRLRANLSTSDSAILGGIMFRTRCAGLSSVLETSTSTPVPKMSC